MSAAGLLLLGVAMILSTMASAQTDWRHVPAALERCMQAIETKSTKPFADWPGYSPTRFIPPGGSLIAGLGTFETATGPRGYCLVTPGDGVSFEGLRAAGAEALSERLAARDFVTFEAVAPDLNPEFVADVRDRIDNGLTAAFACRFNHKVAFLVRAGEALRVHLLGFWPKACEERDN